MTNIGKWIQLAYWYIWFYTEFLVKDKKARRPFTFILRDFEHHRPYIFWPLVLAVLAGMLLLTLWNVYTGFFIGGFCWMLLAHLDWGQPYVPHQQENPPFIPDD